MADELDPPRKFYQLKPRTFEQVNPLPPDLPPPENLPPPPSAKIEINELYRQAQTAAPLLTPDRGPGPKNEVHAVLEHNLARANAAGLYELAPKPKRRSRRTRDFLMIAIPSDAFFVFVAFGPYSNVATMAYGLAGVIISTIGLGWIMFFVMDDY